MEHIKSYLNNLITNSSLITISIVTYLGYLFAYLFELESARFYNIPAYLVQIELLPVLFTAVITYFFLAVFVFIIFQLAYLIQDIPFLHKVKIFFPEKERKRLFNYRFLIVVWGFALVIIAPIIIAQYFGEGNNFLVTFQKDNKEYAIVKIYGDSAISLSVASESGVLTSDIYIFPKDQEITGTLKYFDKIKVKE